MDIFRYKILHRKASVFISKYGVNNGKTAFEEYKNVIYRTQIILLAYIKK